MVLARVKNVKSGWKSMFMVFTTAATDDDLMIVRLAFETIEKIVREHFEHITETEVSFQASQSTCTDGAIYHLMPWLSRLPLPCMWNSTRLM